MERVNQIILRLNETELDTLTTEAEEALYLRSETNYITEIQTGQGITTDQLDINKQFWKRCL